MARLPRIVLPAHPHHVTQHGNRRNRVFFEEGDYALHIDLLSNAALNAGSEITCYCLLPNHVNLMAGAMLIILDSVHGAPVEPCIKSNIPVPL